MTWVSGLPAVATSAARPTSSIPRNAWAAAAALHASSATWRSPSVPFLKPIGIDSPEASWRWIWLSVVRAPIAPQATRSATYWGLMGSRNSVAAGVFQARLGVVDGAGAHDDEQPVVHTVHDGPDLVPAPPDHLGQAGLQGKFRHEVLRGGQRGELADAQVRGGVLGAGGCFDAHIRVLFRVR